MLALVGWGLRRGLDIKINWIGRHRRLAGDGRRRASR